MSMKNGNSKKLKHFQKPIHYKHYKVKWELLSMNAVRTLSEISFSKRNRFYKDIITFDIETTTIDKENNFMYIFMLCINGKVFYHWDWNYFISFINYLKSFSKEFVIWVHNLSFEFAYIQQFFKWEKVFCTSPHKVIFCKTGNVTFRCTYFMTNLSLEKIPKVFDLPIKKLKGDLDYSLIRLPEITPLKEKEKMYCINDVLILYHLILKMIEKYGNFNNVNLPYTSTGFTRKHIRENAKADKEYGILRNIVKESSTTDIVMYHMFQRAFAGGYTHLNYVFCNFLFTPENCNGVRSRDKKSFYPAIMCKNKFPRKFFKAKSEKFFELYKKGYAIIFDVCFKNIRTKTSMTTISEHKCSYLKKADLDNGRIYKADLLVTTITELDFEIINLYYDYDSIKIGRCFAAKKRYLPKTIVKTILDLYENKTTLKDVKGAEQEYQRLKALLNSTFGCAVTDIIQPIILYFADTLEFKNEPLTEEQQIQMLEDYKNNFQSLLLYQTGVYVTAYSRNEILKQNWEIGEERIIYNDTDSTKYLWDDETEQLFEKFNKENIKQLKQAMEHFNIDFARTHPKDIYGNEHQLGEFAVEETYKYFKSLGSKRYVFSDGKNIFSTIAGLPKSKANSFFCSGLKNYGVGAPTIKQCFDKFTNQMLIPSKISGKNTHYYTLPQGEKEFIDYLGNKGKVFIGTGISLIPQSFEMNLSKKYKSFLTQYPTIVGLSHGERLANIKSLCKIKTYWSDYDE